MIVFKGMFKVLEEGEETLEITKYQTGGSPELSFKNWDALAEWGKKREREERDHIEVSI